MSEQVCPKCGAELAIDDMTEREIQRGCRRFTCDTANYRYWRGENHTDDAEEFFEMPQCLRNQRDAALARAERAEARLKSAEFWRDWVYPDGATPEQIHNELHDYKVFMDEVAVSYGTLTCGRISKPNTKAFEVINCVEEIRRQELEKAEAREAELSKHLEWVLEEAEKAHMGYPSPAEEWFALRDSAKAALSSDDGGSAMLDRLRSAEAKLEALREMMSVPGSSICQVFQPTMSNKNYIYSGRKNYKPRVVRACTFDELIDQWQKAGG